MVLTVLNDIGFHLYKMDQYAKIYFTQIKIGTLYWVSDF